MISITLFLLIVSIAVHGEEYRYVVRNVSRSPSFGMQAYRSALTLDWLSAEDTRQRQVIAAFVTEPPAPTRIITTECINYPRPSSGKVAKLMLELLKNLEGDDGVLVPRLIGILVKSKLLVETSMLDSEPNLDSLVKTPTMMMGEPHVTFPRILAIVWMLVADATTTRTNGWCPINKVNEYLSTTKPTDIAKHMRMLEPVLARARYIMEEFIQRITPINIYPKKSPNPKTTQINKQTHTTTEETVYELDKWSNSSEEETPHRPPEETYSETARSKYEGNKIPRSSEDERVKSESQEMQSIATYEQEYASTQFLEQAQQVAKIFEDIESGGKVNRLKGIVNTLSFMMCILFAEIF